LGKEHVDKTNGKKAVQKRVRKHLILFTEWRKGRTLSQLTLKRDKDRAKAIKSRSRAKGIKKVGTVSHWGTIAHDLN